MLRADFARLSDLELRVCADGLRHSLSVAWSRGESGSTTQIYDLALACTEANLRNIGLRPLGVVDQLELWPRPGLHVV